MKTGVILFVILILTAAVVAVTAAKADSPDNGIGQQVQDRVQDRLQDTLTPIRNQTVIEDQIQNRTQDRLQDMQTPIRNQTRAINITLLRQELQERKQVEEQTGLPAGQQRVVARYSNVSAFVHFLLNETGNNTFLDEGMGGIGPQVHEYAQEFNNSLQAQIQAEERIENRNTLVRFFVGGDAAAAATLEQEAARNQERIQELQQLIAQCQDCDVQVKEMLQTQLQEMESMQIRLSQLAQNEKQDRGIFGWLGK